MTQDQTATEERLRKKYVTLSNGCWQWVGAIKDNGYGVMSLNGKSRYGHRISYEMFKGPIMDGLEIDHLCRNRSCVNPDHLEAVTHTENTLRGQAPSVLIRKSGFCIRGHPMAPENRHPTRGYCVPCMRAWWARRRARIKAAKIALGLQQSRKKPKSPMFDELRYELTLARNQARYWSKRNGAEYLKATGRINLACDSIKAITGNLPKGVSA